MLIKCANCQVPVILLTKDKAINVDRVFCPSCGSIMPARISDWRKVDNEIRTSQ